MLNEEIRLINQILLKKDFSTVEKLKVSEPFFKLGECREAFSFIKNYSKNTNTLGYTPSIEEFKKRFANFQLLDEVKDELPVLCEELRRSYMHRQFDELFETGDVMRRSDPYEALGFVYSNSGLMMSQHTANNRVIDLKDSGDMLIERYRLAKTNKGILGTPFPWQSLNEETMGILNGTWTIIYGRPGEGKTTTAIGLAADIFDKYNKRIGVFNFEDESEDLLMLFTCFLCKVDFLQCKRGQLNPVDEERYEYTCRELRHYDGKNGGKCFFVEEAQGCNVAHIKDKIEEYGLDIAIINGVYFIKNPSKEKGWEAMAEISRECKQIAKQTGCATFGLTQASKAGEVAFTDAFLQDCDTMLKIEKHYFPDGQGVKISAQKVRGGGKAVEFYVENYPGLSIRERLVEPTEAKVVKTFMFKPATPKFTGKK